MVGAQAIIEVYAPGASSVQITAYYATNPNDVSTVAWRDVGIADNLNERQFWFNWNTTSILDQNNTGWGTELHTTPTYNGTVATSQSTILSARPCRTLSLKTTMRCPFVPG